MAPITHVNDLPGSWISADLLSPITNDEGLDVAKSVAPRVSQLLSGSPAVLDSLFHPDGFWRDLVALSWSLRTFHPTSVISAKVNPLIQRAGIIPESIALQEDQVAVVPLPNGVIVVRAPFVFKTSTPATTCTAVFKLIRLKNGTINVFTATTTLLELDAMPWSKVPPEVSKEIPETLPDAVDVLIVGGGHSGLTVSSHLKAMGVNFALVEANVAIGDSWAKRYDSAKLHTTRPYSGLPYVPLPDDFPQYIPAKKMAAYYAQYAKDMQIPAYPGRRSTAATWDADKDAWKVTLTLTTEQGGQQVLFAKHLVFAVGIGGRVPNMPDYPGMETFRGESLHSGVYTNASRWAGKRVAIVGASTTALDMLGAASATVVQRGPTRLYLRGQLAAAQKVFWPGDGSMTQEVGDTLASEDPNILQSQLSAIMMKALKDAADPEYYEDLRKAGFLHEPEGPIHQQVFCRIGAHYPDVGACDAIRSGEILIKSGTPISSITPRGITFDDGSKLDHLDVIVWATGFQKDSRQSAALIVGEEVVQKLDPGEVRGCFRPSGNDRIWFQGGELQSIRHFGKFLALQVAADVAGVRPKPCTA
ncbi:hypothetical protein FB45DRAFT_926639 [Roridomyces roridus]|uniref:FAD/NAD(P)-binding domain-containing protein n=1 Tax=Roridomyces roridus TaxID=1738132 RepID=A0AAD7FJJ1_9AGAR|nr:hypothetical protein FB45DRAFT_926639 [Roridomyces roridus]